MIKNHLKYILISLAIILILQLIALWPSFQLALFGDDWLAFWRAWINSDANLPAQAGGYLNPVKYFLTPYGPQDMNMGLLRGFLGLSSGSYYIVSFLWRLSVAYALFFMVLKLTNNKLAALFSGTFFAVSAIGLDTTNWVFNMTSYIGLLFLIVFTFCYFRSRQLRSYKIVVLAFIFLFLAIVIVPIRMHGALIVIFFSEIIWFLQERTKSNLKYTVFRVAMLLGTLLVIKIIGASFGDPNETVNRTRTGLLLLSDYIHQGHFWVLLIPVMSFGNMILPDVIWTGLGAGNGTFFFLSLLIFITYMVLIFIFTPKQNRTDSDIYKLAAAGIVVNFGIWLIQKYDFQNFSSPSLVGAALIGSYTSIILINLIIKKFFEKKYLIFAAIIFFWPWAFILMPWITLNTGTVFPTFHRYMIVSSAGIALVWAFLALLQINRKALIVVFTLTILVQLNTTYNFLDYLVSSRGKEISEKIWDVLEGELPHFDTKKTYVVLFASDTQNGDVVYNTAFFGFPPRMALRDRIWNSNRTPIAVTRYQEIVSAVTDGKVFLAHGHSEKPISPDQTITFLITGRTLDNIQVQNITEQTRKDLKSVSDEYLKTHPDVSYQN